MATITAKQVNELRKITGAGMMDCKKALVEANGDIEEAIKILRKKGQKVSEKRADREANEGSVFTTQTDTSAVLVAVGCETDFVARNDDFKNLGASIANLALSSGAADLAALTALKMEDGRSVSEHVTDAIGKIGEKIEIGSYALVTGDAVVTYVHPGARVGVAVAFTGVGDADIAVVGKDVAMQIAAMKPLGVDEGDVDPAVISREREIARDRAIQDGKPENILDRIADGTIKKFLKLNTLVNQEFVKDTSKTVGQYLKEANPDLKVKTFSRLQIGQ
ncbi:MAG: translation elongation factor Ts [Bacteroidota bacterium]